MLEQLGLIGTIRDEDQSPDEPDTESDEEVSLSGSQLKVSPEERLEQAAACEAEPGWKPGSGGFLARVKKNNQFLKTLKHREGNRANGSHQPGILMRIYGSNSEQKH